MRFFLFRPYQVALGRFFPTGTTAEDVWGAVKLFFVAVGVSLLLLLIVMALIAAYSWVTQQDAVPLFEAYTQGVQEENQVILPRGLGWHRILPAITLFPFMEELLFRGFLYGALRKRYKPWRANLISSAVFAISHHYVFGLPNVLLIGIVCAVLYERTRSLRAPMLFHMLWNVLCVAWIQPVMWIVLLVLIPCLSFWARSKIRWDPASRWRPGKRWKVYCWIFIILSSAAYWGHWSEIWKWPLEWPAFIALYAYSYRSKRFNLAQGSWVAYGIFYIVWMGWEYLREFQAQGLGVMFSAAGTEAEAVGSVVVVGASSLILFMLLIAPMAVMFFRFAILAYRGARLKASFRSARSR